MSDRPSVLVRRAEVDESDWVNARYDDVKFVHSDLRRDIVAIAELDGVRAGLGRIVPLSADSAELGGMYVFDKFRGKGLAREIVQYLLGESSKYSRLYCLPFAHLEQFYSSFGFTDGKVNQNEIPSEIVEKHRWCNSTYEHETLLLVRIASN